MSLMKVNLPNGIMPVNGLQVSFRAPVDSDTVNGIQIDGQTYTIMDAHERSLCGCSGLWGYGDIVTVTLDVTRKRAFLLTFTSAKPFRAVEGAYDSATGTYLYELTYNDAGSVLCVQKPGNGSEAAHNITIPDADFRVGDTLEIINNSSSPVYINCLTTFGGLLYNNDTANGGITNYASILHKAASVKLIYTPGRRWIMSGDYVVE